MNIRETAAEIGMLATMQLIEPHTDDPEILSALGDLPVPCGVGERIAAIADALNACPKKTLMLLAPEMALIDALAERNTSHQIILIMPCDMDPLAAQRLRGNIPEGFELAFLDEPFSPAFATPGNSALLAFGFQNDYRIQLSQTSYRLMERYGTFPGLKLFIPYTTASTPHLAGYIDLFKNKEDWFDGTL